MRHLLAWVRRLTGLVGHRRTERELANELEAHIQLHIDDNIRSGLAPDEARRQALIKFGPVEAYKEAYRDRASLPLIESTLQDIRFGIRSFGRHTGFAVLAVSTLAIGVGATAAMLGLVDAVMLRPLPHVREPERLAVIEQIPNAARFRELASRVTTLDLAGYMHVMSVSLDKGPEAISVEAQCVTGPYFSVVGTSPAIGRDFASEEMKAGGESVVIIAHGMWMRRFGADPHVLGRQVTIAGQQHTIVGVAPRGFRGIGSARVDAWLPLDAHAKLCVGNAALMELRDGGFWLTTIGRVRDGVTVAQATADAQAADSDPPQIEVRKPDGSIETKRLTDPPLLTPVNEALRKSRGSDNQLALWLAGGAAVLMLIATANVAGLLAARAVDRRREIAVRMQLGASRSRVFRQLLSENLVLSMCCGIAAIGIAWALEAILLAFYPLADGEAIVGGRTPLVIAVLALIAGLMSGAVPAFQAARADVSHHLRTGRSVGEPVRFGGVLLIGQAALALMLMVGAGLFVRSVDNYGRELGYHDRDRVLTASIDFSKAGVDVSEAHLRYQQMLERVRALPDVEFAALTSAAIAGARGGTVTGLARKAPDSDNCCHAAVRVSTDFFATVGTKIVRGRAFSDADMRSGAQPVVILEQELATQIFGAEDPLGQCVHAFFSTVCNAVVGISDSARRGLLRKAQFDSQFFLPLSSSSDRETAPQMLVVRQRRTSAAATAAIATAIRSASPDLPYVAITPLADLVNLEARRWRMGATLFGLFGTLAVTLAAVGIYGALAFTIRHRTPEIGVRVAFGAAPFDIVRMVVKSALSIVAAGWIVGAMATFVATRSLASLLFDVSPAE